MGDKEKVLRNVSLDEIEALRKKDAVDAMQDISSTSTETDNTPKKAKKAVEGAIEFKTASSVFEPKGEPVKLPSRNLFVKENLTANFEIYVKRMGSVEEAIFYNLMNTRDPQAINEAIDKVIDNCIKTKISAYDLCLIDKFTVFLKILHLTYGSIDVKLTCPDCNTAYEMNIDMVKDLVTKYLPDKFEYPRKIHLTTYDDKKFNLNWYVNYLTIGQANTVLIGEANIDSMLLATDRIEGKFINSNGEEASPTQDDYAEILRYLNDEDRETYRAFMQEIGDYGTNFEIKNKFCPQKGCIANTEKKPIVLPPEQIFMRIIRINNVNNAK